MVIHGGAAGAGFGYSRAGAQGQRRAWTLAVQREAKRSATTPPRGPQKRTASSRALCRVLFFGNAGGGSRRAGTDDTVPRRRRTDGAGLHQSPAEYPVMAPVAEVACR